MSALPIVLAALAGAVSETSTNWHDAVRDRDIPVKIYAPVTMTNPVPLIVFSHGLGGTRDGYRYLGEHWASNGFICVHVQHAGSDDTAWRDQGDKFTAMRQAALDPKNWSDRPRDVSFAITQMLSDRRVNANAIGVAGHSFGAHTTLLILGQRVLGESYRDPRVKAGIAMSSSRAVSGEVYRDVTAPCLHLTGTKDDSPIFNQTAADRRYAFDHIAAPEQWLLTLADANHMTFAGRGVAQQLAVIRQTTTAFWDANLKGNTGVLAELRNADAVVEHK